MKSLQFYWYQPGCRLWPLLPLSWLYCALVVMRRRLYQYRLLKSYRSPAPLIVVGNIVSGGSGKTPLLLALAEYLQQHGLKPGVVSRGYGGKFSGIRQVQDDDSAAQVGDEPLMIRLRSRLPVVVAADRVAAVNCLLLNNDCDIVLSDDGLQHYRMHRDLEIAVVDASRRNGNGHCLPAGPLREPVSRLDEVDIVAYHVTGYNSGDNNAEPADGAATAAPGPCSYALKTTAVHGLYDGSERALSSFAGKTLHAVAGIGHPARFFQQLRDQGLDVIEHAFADHHAYQQHDFSGWQQCCIIMTEKDAVKCRHLLLDNAWVLAVDAELSAALRSRLDTWLCTQFELPLPVKPPPAAASSDERLER